MPNLRTWIEAQLKEGHNQIQIKADLIRYGYPPSSVALVDNIASEHNMPVKSKNSAKSTKNITIFLVVLALAVILFVSIPKKAAEMPMDLSEKEIIPVSLTGVDGNNSAVNKTRGKLVNIEGNIFDILDEKGVHIIIINSDSYNNFTLRKKLQNGTVVYAGITELKPNVNVTVSTLKIGGQTVIHSIMIWEHKVEGINVFNGKLVKIGDNNITIKKEKKLTTLLHSGPINKVPVLKKLPGGITEGTGWQELKIGSEIRVFAIIRDGESVISSILIKQEAK